MTQLKTRKPLSRKGRDMTDSHDKPWIVEMCCPFCGEVIVRTYDYSLFTSDLSEEEEEEIRCGTKYLDMWDGHCEHLAYFSDWAYSGSRVEDKWAKEVAAIKGAFGESGLEDDLGFSLLDAVKDEGKKEKIQRQMQACVKDIEIALEGGYVEKNDGVKGSGGPTFMLIFMRRKPKERKLTKRRAS